MDIHHSEWEIEKKNLIIQRDRLWMQFTTAFQWLELLEDGTNIIPYFKEQNSQKIAIYGAAELGRMLLKELEKDSSMSVLYFIDKSADKKREKWGKPVYLPSEFKELPEVDIVVVTAVSFFEAINKDLIHIRPEIPIVSLNAIVETRRDEVWYEKQ